MSKDKIVELFEQAVGKRLDDGVLSIHSTEVLRFAELIVSNYAAEERQLKQTMEQCDAYKTALQNILNIEHESDEWDAVERVLPEIFSITSKALDL